MLIRAFQTAALSDIPESPVPQEKDPLPGAASPGKHRHLVQGRRKARTKARLTCPYHPLTPPVKELKGEKAEVKQRQLCPCCHPPTQCQHSPQMHLPKETWAPSTAGWAGRDGLQTKTFPGMQEELKEAIRPKGTVLESTYTVGSHKSINRSITTDTFYYSWR